MEQGGEGSATLLGEGDEGVKKDQGKGIKRKKGKKGGDVAGGHCYRSACPSGALTQSDRQMRGNRSFAEGVSGTS